MAACGALVLIVGCSQQALKRDAPDGAQPAAALLRGEHPPDAVPRATPRSRHGNPPHYTVWGKRYDVLTNSAGYRERGIASWYGRKFHGRRSASGETYNMYAMTAAHRSLPLPTYVRVTNLANGRQVIVKVNDRGPFHDDRLIDLSYAAARKLGMIRTGTARVEVRAIQPPQTSAQAAQAKGDADVFIQVGAFARRAHAQRLRARLLLQQVGNVNIVAPRINEHPVYRVRIGPFSSVKATDAAEQRLRALGVKDYELVAK